MTPLRMILLAGGMTLAGAGGTSAAVTQDNFNMTTTSDLVSLCSAAPNDPMVTAAVSFCHGFLLGVFRTFDEEQAASRAKTFCIVSGQTNRSQAVAGFIAWANATPGVLAERPADAFVHYLSQTFPCPSGR